MVKVTALAAVSASSLMGIPLCFREIPHPQDAYRYTTDKFKDSGGVWRVHLVQGLHGH